ncbi:MAG TPA: hypothetical protein VFG86_06420 [Chloroflexota bacterium]|nr:hypothetical protein [Chloroflexota bacterium]
MAGDGAYEQAADPALLMLWQHHQHAHLAPRRRVVGRLRVAGGKANHAADGQHASVAQEVGDP